MSTHGIRVYFVNDQVGIPDNFHQLIKFDTVLYDTDGEWDGVKFEWHPKFLLPTIVRLTAHISWATPAGVVNSVNGGYGKIWTHWHNAGVLDEGHGEGAVDGPLSQAAPRIGYHDERLCQPGDFCHVAARFFSGANGHAVQAGAADASGETPNRSYFAASYEA